MKERVQRLADGLTMEHVLLAIFVGTSAYMLYESREFGDAAQPFPQFTAGAVIVLGVLLLLREYLPAPLQRLVKDDVDTVDPTPDGVDSTPDEADGYEEDDGHDEETAETDEDDSVQYGALFTGALCVAYLVGSFLVGMLWVTPVFVFTYMRWTDQTWPSTLGLTGLSFAVAFAFYDVLNLDIHQGLLHEIAADILLTILVPSMGMVG